MKRIAGALLGLVAACQGTGAPEPESDTRAQAPRALHREFAVFAQPELTIEHVGAPVAAPVTVGSLASPATMASDDPEVVEVAPDGTLVAHRRGSTRVRGVGTGSVLGVRVKPRVLEAEATPSKRGTARRQP